MRRNVVVLSLIAPLLTLALATAAPAQDAPPGPPGTARLSARGLMLVEVKVIYTNIASDPSSDVPGLPGVKFQPGTGTTHFDRVYGSPDGKWALTALADLPTTEDELLLVDDVVQTKEGGSAAWTMGELVGPLDTKLAINNAGTFTFAADTNGPTTSDEYIVRGLASSTLLEEVQEGDSAAPPLPGGATWGTTLESSVITADGTIGFVADLVAGVATTMDEVAVLGSTIIAQEGVTVPAGQVGSEAWENFDLSAFWVTPDGMHTLLQGDLAGATATDDVVVVDGTVVVQEGVVLAGSGFTEPVDASGIVGSHLTTGGQFLVRGNNDVTEVDWVYGNSGVVAAVGSPIIPSTGELWSDVDFADCFFLHVGNTAGDFILGGVTNAASIANGALVLNNDTVIVRETDPIDLDGNGMFDDDVFFDTFGNDDGYFADNGLFYFVATIKDGTNTRVGQGFFVAVVDAQVFVDGFESGDTSAWSATIP